MSSYGQVFASQIASTVIPGAVMQAAATGNGNGTALDVSGYATCNLAVSGTFVATINFEASVDGSSWVAIRGVEIGSASGASTATAAGVIMFNCAGLNEVRARISDYVSGSITVDGYVSALAGMTPGVGTGGGDINIDEVGGNATAVGNGTTDSGTLRVTISSDSTGVIGLTSGSTVGLSAGSATIGSINNVSGTVSLPTGAATSAKQPALGTAGTAAIDVITVQGIASMTPLKVDASGASLTVTAPALELAQDSATSGQTGPLVQAAVSTSAPSYTNAKTNPLSLTTSGALRVDASGTTVPISASSLPLPSGAATAAKQPALGTAGSPSSDVISVQGVASGTPMPVSFSGSQDTNIAEINGSTVASGSGASNSGTMRVVTSSDSTIAQTASIVPTLTTLQNAATGNGNGTPITTTGYGTCLLSITGSLGGGSTVNFESSADGGTTWVSILGTQVGTTNSAISTTSTGDWVFSCAAQSQIRARISSFGSGVITVKGFLSVISTGGGGGSGGGGGGSVNLTQVNSNSVATGNGAANSGTQRVAVASDSTISASVSIPTINTYSANTNGSFTPLTSATDMITFTGSATTTVKILEIHLSYEVGSTGAANGNRFFLIKRSTANSGGTATTETIVPLDANNSAATAVMKSYRSGSNPTLGTTVGTIWSGIMIAAVPSTFLYPLSTDYVIFKAADYGQPIILRGTSQSICLNNAGVTVSGITPKIGLTIYFTEE